MGNSAKRMPACEGIETQGACATAGANDPAAKRMPACEGIETELAIRCAVEFQDRQEDARL